MKVVAGHHTRATYPILVSVSHMDSLGELTAHCAAGADDETKEQRGCPLLKGTQQVRDRARFSLGMSKSPVQFFTTCYLHRRLWVAEMGMLGPQGGLPGGGDA